MKHNPIPRMKLRNQIMLLAVVAQLFIVGVAGLLGLMTISSNNDLLAQTTLGTLELVSANLSESLGTVNALTYQLLSDTNIQQELSRIAASQSAQEQLASYHLLYDRLIRLRQENRQLGLTDVQLVTSAYTVNTSYLMADAERQAILDEVTQQAKACGGQLMFYTELCGEGQLIAARAIRQISPFDLATTGVLILSMDMDQLVQRAANSTTMLEQCYWIIDKAGEVFYTSQALKQDAHRLPIRSIDQSPCVVSLPDGHYFMAHGHLAGVADWGYTLLIPYEKQWRAQVSSYALFILVLGCAIVLASLLSNMIVRSITRRLEALLVKINGFQRQMTESGGEAASLSSRTQDEIAVLHSHFDSMAEQISTLVQERYVGELLTKEAQLQALESQINPHFLYNVLESINSRARLCGNREITATVEALGRLLRTSLDGRVKIITLRQELALVHDYILIQKQRYEDELTYTERIPEDLLDVTLPKLAIQPLIDNAIKYALENGIDDMCSIEVAVCELAGNVMITVSNSGSAFPQDMVGELQPDKMRAHGLGIGLVNIHQRLRLIYGEEGSLCLDNVNGLAVCRLSIPCRQQNAQKEDDPFASHADR